MNKQSILVCRIEKNTYIVPPLEPTRGFFLLCKKFGILGAEVKSIQLPREICPFNCAMVKPVFSIHASYTFPQLVEIYTCAWLRCSNPFSPVCVYPQLAWCYMYIRWLYPKNKLNLVQSFQVVRVLNIHFHLIHEVISPYISSRVCSSFVIQTLLALSLRL